MGGKIIEDVNKVCATHWVFYLDDKAAQSVNKSLPSIVKCHYTYITECYFQNGLISSSPFEI